MARKKVQNKKYKESRKGRLTRKKYERKSKVKARKKVQNKKYRESRKGKITQKRAMKKSNKNR